MGTFEMYSDMDISADSHNETPAPKEEWRGRLALMIDTGSIVSLSQVLVVTG